MVLFKQDQAQAQRCRDEKPRCVIGVSHYGEGGRVSCWDLELRVWHDLKCSMSMRTRQEDRFVRFKEE